MYVEKIKEELSICYLNAIAAVKGIALEQIKHDDDSTDVILKKVVILEDNTPFNVQIRVQLKATSSVSMFSKGQDGLTYKLKVKNYNDLCQRTTAPVILALLVLPEKEEEWIKWSRDELLLRGKMFWLSLYGKQKSDNTESVSVTIPLSNVLNNETIEMLLARAAMEGHI